MIVLHQYKLIFLKTTKTAGTSIEVFLSQFADKNDIVTPVYPPEEGHEARNYQGFLNPVGEILEEKNIRRALGSIKASFKSDLFYNHMSAVKVKHRLSEPLWNDYYKFAVERNPWDKTVSWYNMVKKRRNINIDFQSFLDEYPLPFDTNKYMDVKNKHIIVNQVIRYENLNEDLKSVFEPLGIEFSSLSVRAKSSEVKVKKHYSEYYLNQKAIDLVAAKYAKEIELFSYTFDDRR